jgi:Flp pilus assembly protein TadG
MMKKLDNRGVASWEFILVMPPLFMLIFVIFDLGRYAITIQSLQTLADAGARAAMISCYTKDAVANKLSSVGTDCTSPCSAASTAPAWATSSQWAQVQTMASVISGLTPQLCFAPSGTNLNVTAKVTFSVAMTPLTQPLWPSSFNNPSAATSIPF